MGNLLAIGRTAAVFFGYLGFALIGTVLKVAPFLPKRRRALYITRFTRHWARFSCLVFNIRVRHAGALTPAAGSLIVSNHVGTPDIFILGSCFPAFYVSKAEIAGWPLFNWMARLGDTIFADRSKRHQVKSIVAEMTQRLREGCSVIVFPEAKATDGRDVIPFKSSPFEAAIRAGRPVQPVTIVYHDGNTPSIACWVETSFFQHILRLLRNPRLEATAHILPPVSGETDRRILAQKCHQLIREVHHRQSAPRAKSPGPDARRTRETNNSG